MRTSKHWLSVVQDYIVVLSCIQLWKRSQFSKVIGNHIPHLLLQQSLLGNNLHCWRICTNLSDSCVLFFALPLFFLSFPSLFLFLLFLSSFRESRFVFLCLFFLLLLFFSSSLLSLSLSDELSSLEEDEVSVVLLSLDSSTFDLLDLDALPANRGKQHQFTQSNRYVQV